MSADRTSCKISVIDHQKIIDPLAMVAALEMIESTEKHPRTSWYRPIFIESICQLSDLVGSPNGLGQIPY
jgi:hypothetical protein